MSISKLFSGGGLAALAAVLVITAVPAQAQDKRNWRAEREESGARQDSGRQVSEQRNWNRGAQQARQQQVQPQLQQAQPQRTWQRGSQPAAPQGGAIAQERSGRDWNRSERRSQAGQERSGRDWNRGGGIDVQAQVRAQRQAQVQAQAQAEAQARAQRQQRDWNATRSGNTVSRSWDRNGSNAGRDRNQTYRNDNDRNWRDQRGDNRNWRDNDRRGDNRDWRDNDRRGTYAYRDGNGDQRQWDRRWRDNNRYNWYQYRNANRSVYRMGSYYAPYRNYSYRRLSIGFFLDNLFYSNRYWINDPWQYRLPEVYGPYRWVRYYDDALLVDIYSGEVVDAIHDFFW